MQQPTYDETDQIEYFFQFMNGLRSDDYVPGSITCGLDVIASNKDFNDMLLYFSDENSFNRPQELKQRREEASFTVLR